MKRLKCAFDFYVLSNIHVAIAGFCITQVTRFKYGLTNLFPSLLVALSIIISYNFIRYYEFKKERLSWYMNWFQNNRKGLFVLNLLSVFLLLYLVYKNQLHINSILILVPCLFITFFYVVPIFKKGNYEISFRNFPSIKIFSIAITWAVVSVFFPLIEAEMDINSIIYLEFYQRLLLVIAITLPFDIRDLEGDDLNLKTIPQLIGVKRAKIVGLILILVCCILEIIKLFLAEKFELDVFIIALITGFFLWNVSVFKSRFYTSFWVESIPIIWYLLLVIFDVYKI